MAESFQCTLITPQGEVFADLVRSAVIPAYDGELGVLVNRAPLMCKLAPGTLRVKIGEVEESWYIDAGFAQVIDNELTVLTEKALTRDQINRAKAEALLKEAQEMKATDDVSARRKALNHARARAMLHLLG